MKIVNRLADRFITVRPMPVGTFHRRGVLEPGNPYRLHLRLHEDGTGLLIVNASTVLELNPTAAELAYHFVLSERAETASRAIAARYQLSRAAASEEYEDFVARLETLISTPELDPVTYLGFERVTPHASALQAPLRLDCALTYRLPAGVQPERAPVKRVRRELETTEWTAILSKAWEAGVPHVVFTGGEATLRPDLPELIGHAETLGQVCGLLTDGVLLGRPRYLQALLDKGLDHVMIVLQPALASAWKAVNAIAEADLFATVHLTLRKGRPFDGARVMQRLARAGIQNLSLSTRDSTLRGKMQELRQRAADLGLTLQWQLPVPYSDMNPVALEAEAERMPDGAGKAWLYVEPDGDVLPTQGAANRVLGNLLRDAWVQVYKPE